MSFGHRVIGPRVECFMLADAAQNAAGKLYVLGGGWDVIQAPQFPLQLPQVSLVIKLAVPWSDADRQQEIRVDLEDEDGAAVLAQPVVGGFTVGRPQQAIPGDDLSLLLTLSIAPLVLPHPGRYVFRLSVDGVELARTTFRARGG
jgi:hypothetical protein